MIMAKMIMHNDTMDSNDMVMMHMSFFWSKDVVMLINGWPNGKLVVKLQGSSPFIGGLVHATFYGLRMALVYLIMLCVMSYNVGVFVFVVAGHVIGCFLVKYRMISRAASKSRMELDPV
ncbi:unnamed protein product [Lactuca saligna]|uniref:Copper transport protein n=1 Tax=Lactuca saligna TaxID=75948 RepID=A0AA35ZSZ3_LACSI|nr:unnamed protein product [Lactuca saligna]